LEESVEFVRRQFSNAHLNCKKEEPI
jgi:hypothetical protein